MALDECRRWKTRQCIAFVLYHLENIPSHINKNRELKQRGRECQRECYKTTDLITEYNHFMWECNHLVHGSPENKRNVGICWVKSLTGFKLDATYANIMQHRPTWCTNERNILCKTCWHNMLRLFARTLRSGQPSIVLFYFAFFVHVLKIKSNIMQYRRIFVYSFCVISICALVFIRTTKSLVLNIERTSQN